MACKLLIPNTEDGLRKKTKNDAFDDVVTMRLIEVDKEQEHIKNTYYHDDNPFVSFFPFEPQVKVVFGQFLLCDRELTKIKKDKSVLKLICPFLLGY